MEFNIDIGARIKKSEKNNEKLIRLQIQVEIIEIRINYFNRKENERLNN